MKINTPIRIQHVRS